MPRHKSDADVAKEFKLDRVALLFALAFPVVIALTFLQIRIVEFEWESVNSLTNAVEYTLRTHLFP